jgi:23S rRNA pseudouridine2605 synthase
MKQRIQKLLANAGVASRRAIEQMVLQGRISVNGTVRVDLPILIDPEHDRVTVDDEPIRLAVEPARRVYFLLNKPKGVYCTNQAQGAQVRAIDLLPRDLAKRVYPVGRLDAHSEGLLLMTNDGELTNQLTHPRYGVEKSYRAVVDGHPDAAQVQRLEKGIWLADPSTGKGFKTAPSRIRLVKRVGARSILEITLRESRNHEVRRMLANAGHKVRELTRIRLGPLKLEGLKPGAFRPLTGQEVRALRELSRHGSAEPKDSVVKPRTHGE